MHRADFSWFPAFKISQSVFNSDNFDRHAICPPGTFPKEQGPFSHYSPKTGYGCRMPASGCEYVLLDEYDTCIDIPQIKYINPCVAYLNNYKPYTTVAERATIKCSKG